MESKWTGPAWWYTMRPNPTPGIRYCGLGDYISTPWVTTTIIATMSSRTPWIKTCCCSLWRAWALKWVKASSQNRFTMINSNKWWGYDSTWAGAPPPKLRSTKSFSAEPPLAADGAAPGCDGNVCYSPASISLNHLIRVVCLRLLDGKSESHVIRLLLCLLSVRLLPAHREGELQLQLLLPVSLGPAPGYCWIMSGLFYTKNPKPIFATCENTP